MKTRIKLLMQALEKTLAYLWEISEQAIVFSMGIIYFIPHPSMY